ncbi:histidine kinase [Micromonospora sp. NPDC002717]|uniref:sensor histidine kinase n=1 Tax=Micromonospora sp. NPDC002717 TaxID=3154424 RepID=UPI00333023F6
MGLPAPPRDSGLPVPDGGGGIRGTWQWTWVSMLALIVAAYAPPAWSLASPDAWQTRHIAVLIVGAASLTASIVFVSLLRSGLGQDVTSARARIVLVVLAVVPWVATSVTPVLSIEWALIPWMAASLIAVDLPARCRWWWLGAAALALALARVGLAAVTGTRIGEMWAVSDTPLSMLFPALVIMLPLASVFQMWLWQVVISLDAAKSERAELARTQERLRFASDLHNIQGHHLQVIALKSELAERVLASAPDAAASLIRETQALAREALEDTRRLVKGYRAVSFAVEAENAAAVLDAAGIHVTTDLAADPPAALDHQLGSLLREATTNIIRHSTARHVTITLNTDDTDRIELSIGNDGVPERPRGSDGSGIATLTEQYRTAGGALTVTTDDGWFTIRGVLPQTAGAT